MTTGPTGEHNTTDISHRLWFGVALSAAAALAFELALSAVFAVTQSYHFAFMTVSLALLGFGASGSMLAAFPQLGRGGMRRWATLAAGQSVAIIVSYALVIRLPFDPYAIGWDRQQYLLLALSYIGAATPFFWAGALLGSMLQEAERNYRFATKHVYSASLVGAGVGCVAAVVVMEHLGPTFLVLSALASALGAVVVLRPGKLLQASNIIAMTAAAGFVAVVVAQPSVWEPQASPHSDLSQALRDPFAELLTTVWDRGTRIDYLASSAYRSLPGLSVAYDGRPPSQNAVTFGGNDLSPVPLEKPADAAFVEYMLASVPFALQPVERAAILEPRGGLDTLVALASGAGSVVVVEPHHRAIDAARGNTPGIHNEDRVSVLDMGARAFAERSTERFDVVSLALTTPFRSVTSGVFSLAEDFRSTAEAFDAYLELVAPGGTFSAIGWVQTPPSEETRLVATAAEAIRRRGGDPSETIVAIRSFTNLLVLVKPDGLTQLDIQSVRNAAKRLRFDIVAAPNLAADEVNRFNRVSNEQYSSLAADVLSTSPETAYATHPFAIAPATDDRPFPDHYFKWPQAKETLDSLGTAWQPFGGAGYFLLVVLLCLAALAATMLILAPVAIRLRIRSRTHSAIRRWTVGYFSLLGIGFLFIEIPLIQRYVLLIGRPLTAFAVVIFGLLVAAGVGSAISGRIPWRSGGLMLAALALATAAVASWSTSLILQLPDPLRVAAGIGLIAPMGVLMGIMFPRGIARLEGSAPDLIAWAWCINSTVAVVASIAAVMLALSLGLSTVIVIGAACYILAALMAGRPGPTPPEKGLGDVRRQRSVGNAYSGK